MAPNPYAKALGGQESKQRQRQDKPAARSDRVADGARQKATPSFGALDKTQRAKINDRTARARDADDSDDVLRREVLALGGDEDEVRMLEALGDSDSEIEDGDAKQDSVLAKELKSFMKGLDFASFGGGAASLDEDDAADNGAADEQQDVVETADDGQDEQDSDAKEPQPDSELPSSSKAPAKQQQAATAKKESKREREDRRIAEREQVKQTERELKDKLVSEKEVTKAPKIKSPWIVDPTPQWYAVPVPGPSTSPRPSASVIDELSSRAQELLAKENEMYAASLSPAKKGSAPPPPNGLSKADQVFIQQILTSGTSSDKVSALLLLAASSPLHTMSYLDQLANIAKKKSRDHSGRAIRGIVEWWRGNDGEGGGAPSRKLRAFGDQPGLTRVAEAWQALEKGKGKQKAEEDVLSKHEMEQALVVYAFEDWLKKWFFGILQALEQMSTDSLPHPRQIAVLHLSGLLRDKPEQESNILRLLVNKLGDTNRNIASKTSHHLLQILQVHPGMTPIIVREVSELILRPTAGATAGATPPSGKHTRFGDEKPVKKAAVVKKVRDVGSEHARYYGIICLNQIMLKKGQTDVANRLIEVYFEVFGDILGRIDEETLKSAAEAEDADGTLKRKRNEGDKGKKKGTKGKQGDGEDKPNDVEEYESKLVAAILTGVNRAFPYAQIDEEAIKKRLDTLYRITHSGTFNVSIQALMLIYRVSDAQKDISDRFYRTLYASLHDSRLASSSKQALYLNLLFKAVKQDKHLPRVMAFVKRLMQVMFGLDVVFILGSLFIVSELMSSTPGLSAMLKEAESARRADGEAYDGKKREPLGAAAERSCLWEIVPLLSHWHPTVAQHANTVLQGQPLSATAELESHSLNHFLDRFVYRDLKKSLTTKGSSMMQPGVPGQDKTGRIVVVKGAMRGEENVVNSEAFRRKHISQIPVDQIFFHKYFSDKAAFEQNKKDLVKKRKERKGESFSDDQDVGEDDDEASIADMLDERDDDDSLDGFAEAMQSDDDDEDNVDEEDGVASDEFELVEDDGQSVDADEDEIWDAMKKSLEDEVDSDEVLAGLDDDEGIEEDDDVDAAEFAYSDSELGVDDFDMDFPDAGDTTFQSAVDSEGEDIQIDDDDEDDDDEDEEDDLEGDELDAGLLEDDDDLIDSDEDMPEVDEAQVSKSGASKKAGATGTNKKRKLKHLPVFASADDYAHLLEGGDDEDDDM
ncbi:RNA-binding ribosome biosynthesis protein mak21 [Microbotryomycetes sp. JL201]|nr:RNA-binding ribosome biosynthesis protein mak21 [Microbotryomycetes sp. JL201]